MSYTQPPAIRVHQNRRTTLRRLNQMNGDLLTGLKMPRCSEFGKNVKGHNAARASLCARKVVVWFGEHGAQLERLRRAQDGIYRTMLRMHKEKKKMMRANYERRAEESKRRWLAARFQRRKAQPVTPLVESPLPANEQTYDKERNENSNKETNNNIDSAEQKSSGNIAKSSVLDVSKRNSNTTVYKNELGNISEENVYKDATDECKVNAENESRETDAVTNPCRDRKNSNSHRESAKCMKSHQKDSTLMRTYTPLIDAFDNKRLASTNKCVHAKCTHDETDSHTQVRNKQGKKFSLVLQNRQRKREEEEARRDILNNETFTTYTKASDGSIMSSVAAFKRKQFEPPSQREHFFQMKMVKAQEEARVLQQQRLQDFFHHLDETEQTSQPKRKIEDVKKKPETTPRNVHQLGFALSQMMAVFTQEAAPSAYETDSLDAIKDCKYIRTITTPPNE